MSMLTKVGRRFGRNVTHVEKRAEPEVVCKPRPVVGLLVSLTAEQRQKALSYNGPENHGSDEYRLVF